MVESSEVGGLSSEEGLSGLPAPLTPTTVIPSSSCLYVNFRILKAGSLDQPEIREALECVGG
jgi:hypothetical protein